MACDLPTRTTRLARRLLVAPDPLLSNSKTELNPAVQHAFA